MEIAKQILKRNLTSDYLRQQADSLTEISKLLGTIGKWGHLTQFEWLYVRRTSEVIDEMAQQHHSAIAAVVSAEIATQLLKEKARNYLDLKSARLRVGGKVAFLAHVHPYLLDRGELTMKSKAGDLVGEYFLGGLGTMVDSANTTASKRGVDVEVVIDELWEKFEECRPSLEQKLSGRIRAYEKQLALAAKKPH